MSTINGKVLIFPERCAAERRSETNACPFTARQFSPSLKKICVQLEE